jgi:hypothetical protein
MSHSTCPTNELNSTSTLLEEPGVLVARKHHLPVRASHWLNVPILLGLILSGVSIYWASPIYQHKADLNTGNVDVAGDRNLALHASSWTASLHQSTRLDLQPHEPRARHVGISPASALAVRVPLCTEWRGVRCGADHFSRSPQAVHFISRCSSIGWLRYLAALTQRVFGISGSCSFSSLYLM